MRLFYFLLYFFILFLFYLYGFLYICYCNNNNKHKKTVMNHIQFTTFLADIQPITLPFYLDIYNTKSYDFNTTLMKSGTSYGTDEEITNYIIEIDGYCNYNNYASNFQIVINVKDADNNYIEIDHLQYRELKRTVIQNIVTNDREHSTAI